MIDDRKSIAINYIKSWFFVDLISILPIDLIFMIIYDSVD